jgi:phosphosulfolactate synthase (CoM biosynthesis protein A)
LADLSHAFLYRKSRMDFERYLPHTCVVGRDVTAGTEFSRCLCMLNAKEGKAMIKKVAGGYQVLSEKGKNLGGPYKTKAAAEKRLRQVEFFKHKKG